MAKKVAGAIGACLMLVAALQAQTTSKAAELTAEDYLQIYALYAVYGYSFDGSGTAGLQWGDIFTEDGTHHSGREFFKGRDMLNAFANQKLRIETIGGETAYWLDLSRPNTRNQLTVAHFVTNVFVEPTPEGAKAKAYLMGVNAGSGTIFPRGIYFDTLVKTSEGWRFKDKHFIGMDTPVPPTVPSVFKPKPTS